MALSGLLPLCVQTNDAAQGTGETDETIIKVNKSKGGGRNSDVAYIREKLQLADVSLTIFQLC